VIRAALLALLPELACSCAAAPRATGGAASTAAPALTLAAVGDILLDRGVARQIDRHGGAHPLARVADVLRGAEISFGNLEGPLSRAGERANKVYSFRAAPELAAELGAAGLRVLSLANNHTLDCGRDALVETTRHLARANVLGCGAGRDAAEAERATVVEARGIRVAFVCLNDLLLETSVLREDAPTVAFASEESIRRAVAAARRQAHVTVVSLHWGVEFASRPRPRQERLARVALASGADLVLGHHPHVLQGLRLVSRGASRPQLVAYSLGNFVFDQRETARRQSVVLRCRFDRSGLLGARVDPVEIDEAQPRWAEGSERVAILARLAELSRELGTRISPEGRVEAVR
jgi:poly-gamma-glutamate capsule biosynthesis protein CapA/YwtB (metallophosphatase superfamily)